MADTGPCGPCSEIHIDRGAESCDMQDVPGHVCAVNGDCKRFLRFGTLFSFNITGSAPSSSIHFRHRHVDTGMGFERIVSLLQGTNSNYRTDLLLPLIEEVQQMTGQSDAERDASIHALPRDRRPCPRGCLSNRRWGRAGQYRAQLRLPDDHSPRRPFWL